MDIWITRYETLQNHFTTNFGTFDTVLKKTSEADLTRVFGINMVGYFRQKHNKLKKTCLVNISMFKEDSKSNPRVNSK